MIAAVGDVHGERERLASLLRKIPGEARIVLLGDYVDRGPDSAGVIELLLDLWESKPDTVFLRGNHDQMMLDGRDYFNPMFGSELSFDQVSNWFAWGGLRTLASYPGEGAWYLRVPESHWDFLESTELEYREGPFIFVHAGLVPPGTTWDPMISWSPDPRMWIREPFLDSAADFGGRVIFGHTVQQHGPLVMPNKIGIDTGATFGGPLTAVLLEPARPSWFEFLQA